MYMHMRIYIYIYVCMCICICICVCICISICTCISICIRICIWTYICICIHICICIGIGIGICICRVYMRIHTYIHACMHACSNRIRQYISPFSPLKSQVLKPQSNSSSGPLILTPKTRPEPCNHKLDYYTSLSCLRGKALPVHMFRSRVFFNCCFFVVV